MLDPTLNVLALSYIAGTSTVALWAPTVFRGLGVGPSTIGFLVGLPFLFAIGATYGIGVSSDRSMERWWDYAAAIPASGASDALLG